MNKSLNRWMVRLALGLMVSLVAVVAMGAVYQQIGSRADKRNFPPPGRMIDVNGLRLHINCTGQGSPTVILEAGATGFSSTWAWVQADLAPKTRVCSYDRAGMGWSDESPFPHDGITLARQLRELLTNAKEQGPYVLVGHSLGGIFPLIFTEQYRSDVAGVVLVDTSHPDQLERFPPDFARYFQRFVKLIGYSPILAQIGVLRAMNLFGANAAGLPKQEYDSVVAFAASPKHLHYSYAELESWDLTMKQARAIHTFEDLPLAVVSASVMPDAPSEVIPINHAMHRELATLSSKGTHRVIQGADHFSILMRREDAQLTSDEILKIIKKARRVHPEYKELGINKEMH